MKKNEVSKNYFLTYFGFLNIARTEPQSFTAELAGILRMGLPRLPKQLRDQNNKQKQQKNKNQDFSKNPYFYYLIIIF